MRCRTSRSSDRWMTGLFLRHLVRPSTAIPRSQGSSEVGERSQDLSDKAVVWFPDRCFATTQAHPSRDPTASTSPDELPASAKATIERVDPSASQGQDSPRLNACPARAEQLDGRASLRPLEVGARIPDRPPATPCRGSSTRVGSTSARIVTTSSPARTTRRRTRQKAERAVSRPGCPPARVTQRIRHPSVGSASARIAAAAARRFTGSRS